MIRVSSTLTGRDARTHYTLSACALYQCNASEYSSMDRFYNLLGMDVRVLLIRHDLAVRR